MTKCWIKATRSTVRAKELDSRNNTLCSRMPARFPPLRLNDGHDCFEAPGLPAYATLAHTLIADRGPLAAIH